jgi:hypothetical protein
MHELVAAADSVAVVQCARLNVTGHHNIELGVGRAVRVVHVEVVAADASVEARFISLAFTSRLFNQLSVQVVFIVIEFILVVSIVCEILVDAFARSSVSRVFLRWLRQLVVFFIV